MKSIINFLSKGETKVIWLKKIDKLFVMLVMSVVIVWIITKETDPILVNFFTLIVLPVLLTLMNGIIQKQQENNFYNIDLCMKEKSLKRVV